MQYVANAVQIVGTDQFVTKDGDVRYSLFFSNRKGQPHKVSCDQAQYEAVQDLPMTALVDITVNVDTVGYNCYSDLVDIAES